VLVRIHSFEKRLDPRLLPLIRPIRAVRRENQAHVRTHRRQVATGDDQLHLDVQGLLFGIVVEPVLIDDPRPEVQEEAIARLEGAAAVEFREGTSSDLTTNRDQLVVFLNARPMAHQ
jgi:hypothetical protein